MVWAAALPRRVSLLGLAGAANLAIAAVLLQRGSSSALIVALLPASVVVLGALIAHGRVPLLWLALGLGVSISLLNRPLPIPGGKQIFPADVLVLLALGSWVAMRLLRGRQPSQPRASGPAAIGWPLAVFSMTVIAGVVKGHVRFGEPFFGQPVRLVFYAAIGCALVGLSARQVYNALIAVFYGGTVWMFLNALYFLASGRSQTETVSLSTGGHRVLSLSVAMYISGALFLALLNLGRQKSFRARAVDVAIAMMAIFEIVIAYGRTTFAADAVVLLFFVVFSFKIRTALLAMLPLLVPVLVLVVVFLPRFDSSLVPQFLNRVSRSSSTDVNVVWREKANAAVWRQARESPVTGVGFGGKTSFTLIDRSVFPPRPVQFDISQDPHDSYLWLAAGGGLLCLAAFLLIVVAWVHDSLQRLRRATAEERFVINWTFATLFLFLVNLATGPVLGNPALLLIIWTLFWLPSVVPKRDASIPDKYAVTT